MDFRSIRWNKVLLKVLKIILYLGLNYKNRAFLGIVLIPEKMNYGFQFPKPGVNKIWKRILTHPPREKNLHDMKIVTSKNHGNETLKNN